MKTFLFTAVLSAGVVGVLARHQIDDPYLAGHAAATLAMQTIGLVNVPTPSPTPSGKCTNCNGTGRVGDGTISVECAVCGGDGVVSSDPPKTEFVSMVEEIVVDLDEPRSLRHQKYADKLWAWLMVKNYQDWQTRNLQVFGDCFVNSKAIRGQISGACVVVERRVDNVLYGVDLYVRGADGFSPETNDWYWAQYSAEGEVIATKADHDVPLTRTPMPVLQPEQTTNYAPAQSYENCTTTS